MTKLDEARKTAVDVLRKLRRIAPVAGADPDPSISELLVIIAVLGGINFDDTVTDPGSPASKAMTKAVGEAFNALPTHWDAQMFGESILSILHEAGWTMARTRP